MKRYDIPIKENTYAGLMHLKMTVVDDKVVAVGSFNYTESASTINDEVLLVLRDSALAKEFDGEFNAMWHNAKDYLLIWI